jgi:uncharacterized membrane protein
MDIRTLFGLPAHPLLVHIPVVLVPLASIGALGMWWKPWRDRFGIATVVILMVAGIFTQLAISSGQTLRRELDSNTALLRSHVAIAENIRPWLLLFFIVLVAYLWVIRRREQTGESTSPGTPLLAVLFALTIVLAGISVYWVQRIGHTGAKAVWEPKMKVAQQHEQTDKGDSGGEGGN